MPAKPKIVAIIQARMRSTRLPGKVLAEIAGKPMLWHVVRRVRRSKSIDETLVATSSGAADDAIAAFCRESGIPCYRGSEADVLDRYCRAARNSKADVIVRVTADCPLIDPQVIDRVVRRFLRGDSDYVSNVLRSTYPDGLDVEVISRAALEQAWRMARRSSEREHVTTFIRNSGLFRLTNVENNIRLPSPEMRWTVDTPEDLKFVRRIYASFGRRSSNFGLDAVLELLEKHPDTMKLNKRWARNEGYYRSLVQEPPVPPRRRKLTRTRQLLARARKIIPSCSQTFSKCPTQFVQGVAPAFIIRGRGSHVWDVDENEYIDYPMALGPVILGHNDLDVSAAVVRQMRDGVTYSLPHPLEVEVAELLAEIIPCAEMVRFGKNGSDATAGAVRVARAFTGRDIIACCGYHGWQDWYVGITTRNKGVPKAVQKLTQPFVYNDIRSLDRIFEKNHGKVAAVVMEPVGVVPPKDGFLNEVKKLAKKNGALLVYDEIVTGFRLALGGAQEYFGITPDLACFGKAMGNGFPIAAVVGRKDVMAVFDEVFFSFTFGGETASLAAAKATIKKMRTRNVIGHLWEQGRKLQDGYNVLAGEFGVAQNTGCIGLAPRTVLTFKNARGAESLVYKSFFQQECLKRGVLFSGGQNLCFSHSDADIEHTLLVYRTVMELFAQAIKTGTVQNRLEGPAVQPVFRRA